MTNTIVQIKQMKVLVVKLETVKLIMVVALIFAIKPLTQVIFRCFKLSII
jgi:hypothetical protein